MAFDFSPAGNGQAYRNAASPPAATGPAQEHYNEILPIT